ncbi:MAG: carbohydrate binding family 9 domain-containing protein [Saprospiraceae bacterium]|nr:carbohydrate binding family 9 domain-containing protein [Saprospiraceae bacterium]
MKSFIPIKYLFLLIAFMLLTSFYLKSQDAISAKKSISAYKITSPIKIDGKADEVNWQSAEPAKDFSQYYPDNLPIEDQNLKTEVRVLYDDSGLYILARMYDKNPDSIFAQMTSRDNEGVADNFTVRLNPYNDAQQEFVFRVSASGVQFDELYTIDNESDESWDAIWSSAVSKDSKGWIAEIKIPFSAIRFPKSSSNIWSINFMRKVQRSRKVFSWVFIDRSISNTMLFTGSLTGIENISPPTRLFLIPYTSAYYNRFDGKSGTDFKAGADIKWGISDNFTLDAILIPDFGQTAFDDVEFVLGPFEQEFEERRPFFTEGIDLFSKGDLVYTRRIGQISDYFPELGQNDSIIEFPGQANLINALKISGRTSKGLGIGIANAVTEKAEVKIKNLSTNKIRSEIQSPFSNYNIMVIDQRYGKNNSFTFINTNTFRKGNFRDANVSALLSDTYFSDNKYNIKNEVKFSYLNDIKSNNGIWLSTSVGEIKGKHGYSAAIRYVSKDYNINDLGFNYYRNYSDYQLNYNYKLLNSTKIFNSLNININMNSRFNNETKKPEFAGVFVNINSQNKKNNYFGFNFGGNPFTTYDHYEPRQAGRYMKNFRDIFFWFGISPNYNKKFIVEFFPDIYFKEVRGMWGYELNIEPRYRINDKLVLSASIEFEKNYKDYGFAGLENSEIVIGERNQISTENELKVEYNYSPKSASHLVFRHYWTTVEYLDFFTLEGNGDYKDTDLALDENFSYNNWNIDLSWNYWFAPGSQLTFLYRHSIDSFEGKYNSNLYRNIDNLLSQPQSHTVSLRLSYFLDYNTVKKGYKGV